MAMASTLLRLGLSARWLATWMRCSSTLRRQLVLRSSGWKRHFEQMKKQDREATDELALFGFAHALDFLGDVRKVSLRELAGAQQRRLLIRPGVEIGS